MRLLPLLTTGLVAATLVSAPPASAAGETCHGQAATVVGAPLQTDLTGTEGPDVIVTNGATLVRALGGDDLICVTAPGPTVNTLVYAGAGNDVVDASGATGKVDVELGAGSDTYTGSPYSENVYGGTSFYPGPAVDTERDEIRTGSGGDDSVVSGSDRTVLNSDVVVLAPDDGTGFGNGAVWTGAMAAGGVLDGGGGSSLGFTVGSGNVIVDAVEGQLLQDGTSQLTWTGFDTFLTGGSGSRTPRSFFFRGSDRDEELSLRFPKAYTTRMRLDMAGGDDTLLLGYDDNLGARGSRYIGGPGKDHVALWAGKHLDLDLAQERIKTKRGGSTIRSTFTGFESQLVGAKNVVLKGTKKADDLRFYACRATVRGRAGADDIRQSRGDDYFEAGLRCGKRRFRLFGDRGNDTLRGSTGRDLLVGGPGRDTINGNRGRDTCSGEKLRSCEIRRR